jgi:SagB-type dehydrogenase family enzyme
LSPTWVLSLWEGTTVSTGAEGDLVLSGAYSRLVLRHLSPATAVALQRLVHPGEAAGPLAASILGAEGSAALARWYYHLQELARRHFLLLAVHDHGHRLATLEPTGPFFVLPIGPAAADCPHVLSRFAFTRRLRDEVVLESPLAPARAVLHDDRVAALVHALAQPRRTGELVGRIPGLSTETASDLLALLAAAGMVREVSDNGTTVEDTDPALQCWEFHDLLFHTRSREGRHDGPFGATYYWAGKLAPPPALKPIAAGETIELPRPDLERLQHEDPPFARVVEERCSVREYGAEPITDRQLGEFLYRTVRVKDFREEEVETANGPVGMAYTTRPYPAGGGLYELEVYLAIHACRGLDAGLYHYDPVHHRLSRVAERTPEVGQLLREAAWGTGMKPESVQVLLILAARFPRVSWKYSALAYALILKHVGVVYQTMYLTATAMGLAPCAVGVGNADVFARAAGTDYYAETSVGEFLLGSNSPGTTSPV